MQTSEYGHEYLFAQYADVCVRLKDTIERLFPERVVERKQELGILPKPSATPPPAAAASAPTSGLPPLFISDVGTRTRGAME